MFKVDATSVVEWYRPGMVEPREGQAAHNALNEEQNGDMATETVACSTATIVL